MSTSPTEPATVADKTAAILAILAEHIGQLTTHHHHAERYYVWTPSRHRRWRNHITWHAPLLGQLRQAAHPSDAGDDARGARHGKPAPAAPANLDALDRMRAIETQVADWLGIFLLPARGRPEDDLRALVGATATATPEACERLAADVDRWRLWCLTLAGWRTPPWRPNAPCPHCEVLPGDLAGLRVRLDRSSACCVSCGAVWGPDSVGVLAEHVRQSNR